MLRFGDIITGVVAASLLALAVWLFVSGRTFLGIAFVGFAGVGALMSRFHHQMKRRYLAESRSWKD